jgi:hypothetical protein
VRGQSLLVMIPCEVGEMSAPVQALFDPGLTGAALQTRLGTISGSIERISLRFPAIEGASLEIDATCFISPDWPGPTVLGWRGGLERMRFALDPNDNWFYFAELAAV